MPITKRNPRAALTIGQLLVVIFVVVLLVGVAAPLVVKWRVAAARAQSIQNLKETTLAFHKFNDANKRLPYNGTSVPYLVRGVQQGGPAVAGDLTTGSWAFMILPYLDQKAVFDTLDTSTPVPVFLCPGRSRPALCTEEGDPGAWTDYFLNSFLNKSDGAFDVPDQKRTMVGIGNGTDRTIFVGHGQLRPGDYATTNTVGGFTDVIFNGGSPGLCRNKDVLERDSEDAKAGQWGGPFSDAALMGMGDGTVRAFPYVTPWFGRFLSPDPPGGGLPDE